MNSIDQRTAESHKSLINIKSPLEYSLATLSRAIVSPNGIVVAYADANNNLINAAGGLIGTGLSKAPCVAATTANITIATALNNGDTLDTSVTLATGDRVLVKDQTDASQNGIYIVGVTPTRATDFDVWTEIPGAVVGVTSGTVNAGLTFIAIAAQSGTVGTTVMAFNPFPASTGFTSPIITTDIRPNGNDGATLGTATLSFADLFLASGAVINYANGNVAITHTSGILTMGTGDFRVTTAGTNTASVVTVGGTQTLTNKTLTAPVIGVATGTSLAVTGLITSSSPSAGIGYVTGAQGTAVAQATDRTTGVTCSGMCGQITTQATSLAAQTSVAFTVTNTSVALADTVIVNVRSGPTGTKTIAAVTTVAAGSFQISLFNTDASTADTGAAILNFAVIKAVAS